MTNPIGEADLIRVILADANVLYSRVLRDYLLYAADQEIIAITWSEQILAEVTEHLEQNVAGFDRASGERLVRAMNRAFPFAEVEPGNEHWRALADVVLPDEDDRHVLAAAVAAEATVLCTSNLKDSTRLTRDQAVTFVALVNGLRPGLRWPAASCPGTDGSGYLVRLSYGGDPFDSYLRLAGCDRLGADSGARTRGADTHVRATVPGGGPGPPGRLHHPDRLSRTSRPRWWRDGCRPRSWTRRRVRHRR